MWIYFVLRDRLLEHLATDEEGGGEDVHHQRYSAHPQVSQIIYVCSWWFIRFLKVKPFRIISACYMSAIDALQGSGRSVKPFKIISVCYMLYVCNWRQIEMICPGSLQNTRPQTQVTKYFVSEAKIKMTICKDELYEFDSLSSNTPCFNLERNSLKTILLRYSK